MFQRRIAEKIKTYFMFNKFPHPQNRAIYEEIMCKNIVESGIPQTKTWRMCIVCWIPKAKHTSSE